MAEDVTRSHASVRKRDFRFSERTREFPPPRGYSRYPGNYASALRFSQKLARAGQPDSAIPVEQQMAEIRRARHCRHCLLGGCQGNCLLEDGTCIHGWNGHRPRVFTWRTLLTRRWWHRVLWGR
jgi:hypothetical protein